MPNVMFMVVDEGFPEGNLQQVTNEQFAQLQSYNWELDCGETEGWEGWSDLIFNVATEVKLPATVDATCAVFVY